MNMKPLADPTSQGEGGMRADVPKSGANAREFGSPLEERDRENATFLKLKKKVADLQADVALLQSDIARLNLVLVSAKILAKKSGKFPFSIYFKLRQKYKRILKEIRSAQLSQLAGELPPQSGSESSGHPAGYKAQILSQLLPQQAPSAISFADIPLAPHTVFDVELLTATLQNNVSPTGIVISFSHDHYITTAGGTQLCVGMEEKAAREQGFVYLHAHPLKPSATLMLPETSSLPNLRLSLNGKSIGVVNFDDLVSVTDRLSKTTSISVVIHHLMGHEPDSIGRIIKASGAKAWMWLHDFYSLCPSPHLLRNNVSFCGAPIETSASCGICSYGNNRPDHLSRIRRLFKECDLTVIAPSQFVAELVERKHEYDYRSLKIQGHLMIEWSQRVVPITIRSGPVRVAYCGTRTPHKGWPNYLDLVRRFSHDQNLEFFYFGSAEPQDGLTTVAVTADGDEKDAMIKALIKAEIDLVIHSSATPETFSFTAHEALAAGAYVLTNKSTGNTARLIGETRRGVVFDAEEQVFDFFANNEYEKLVQEVRSRRSNEVAVVSYSKMTIPFLTSQVA